MAGACLGDDTITALLEGALAGDPAGRARAHIATCDACRRLVSAAIDAGPSARPTAPHFAPAPSQALAPTGLPAGALVAGKYRIEALLGEGGMGRVYAARQVGLERAVAIKVLRPELARDATALARFHREARLVASLASEHVARVYDLGALATGEPFLVMERLDGEDLASRVARGPLAVPEAVALVRAACAALAEAHALGIVHRDVKPSNLFLTRGGRLVVIDFGVAKLAAPAGASLAMTRDGIVLGSPRYMAPEQIFGSRDVDARADIWSLGATLYHLVTGAPPFPEPTLEGIFAAVQSGRTPPLLLHLAAPLGPAIQRALARDPAARFATVADFAAALARVDQGETAPRTRRRWIAAGAVAVAAVVVGVAIAAMRSAGEAKREVAPTAAAAEGDATPPTQAAQPQSSPPPPRPVGTARAPRPLAGLDDTRLQARIEELGWRIDLVDHEAFPACEHLRLAVKSGAAAGDVYLFTCGSAAAAVAETERVMKTAPSSWAILDDKRALWVHLPTEAASRELANTLTGTGAPARSPATLGLYAACLNQAAYRVRASWTSYVYWADPVAGPTGKERRIDGIVAVDDYAAGVCVDHLERALGAESTGPLADATRAYQSAFAALVPVVAAAHTYYAHADHEDDDFARGKTLHRELVAAFAAWDAADRALRAAWDTDHRAHRRHDLAAVERAQGRASERYVATLVLDAGEEMIEATAGDARALAAAIAAFAAAFAEMDAFYGPDLTAGTDTDRYMFRQAAEALLVQAKKTRRAIDKAGAPPAAGDGSAAAMREKLDAFFAIANDQTWDGGDAGLRPYVIAPRLERLP
jgi:predicted Ser/Thr protein kinase